MCGESFQFPAFDLDDIVLLPIPFFCRGRQHCTGVGVMDMALGNGPAGLHMSYGLDELEHLHDVDGMFAFRCPWELG